MAIDRIQSKTSIRKKLDLCKKGTYYMNDR